MERVAFHARGPHTGQPCSVVLERRPGPVCLGVGGREVARQELEVSTAEGALRVGVDDLGVLGAAPIFATLAGLGVQHGLLIRVTGPELPLLDGTGGELAAAVRALQPPRDRARLRVIQSGEVRVGTARYSFEPHPTVAVRVELDPPCRASWDGTPRAFLAELAVPEVTPEASCRAHHALFHLLADLYVFGGPPVGRLCAWHPTRETAHAALARGLEFGLLER